VVGVNQFQINEDMTLERLSVDPAIEAGQRRKLKEIRERRNKEKAAELRAHLERAARSDENLIPLFVECVENDVTLGEICNTLRGVWGEYVAQGF
jgi:methylmalonyl-CoA mutase N-terminal domain/subunit